MSRCRIFNSPDDLWNHFSQYVEETIEKNKFPNYAGFRRWLEIPRSTYIRYEKNPDYCNVFERIQDGMEDETLQDNKVHPTIKKLYIQNKFGYVDSQKIDNTNINMNKDVDNMTLEEIEEEIARLERK